MYSTIGHSILLLTQSEMGRAGQGQLPANLLYRLCLGLSNFLSLLLENETGPMHVLSFENETSYHLDNLDPE